MIKAITALFLFVAFANAGDLSLVCFKDNDQGNTIAMADDFMGQDSSSVIFETESDKYVVLVKRETVFTSYHYEMTKINKKTNSFTKKYESVLHYNEVVNVDKNLDCVVTD